MTLRALLARTTLVVLFCVALATCVSCTPAYNEYTEYRAVLPSAASTVSAPSPEQQVVEVSDESASASTLDRPAPLKPDPAGYGFDPDTAIRHAGAIAAFGPRPGGSVAERKAAEYVAARLKQLGYTPQTQEFALPNGLSSVNVIAVAPGRDGTRRLLLGAHLDSKPPSPGANDNASGCGLLLELARILADNPPPVDVELVFWGCEEFLPEGVDSHHLGSRFHAKALSDSERARLVGVMSIDMVGVGSRFHVRTMERGPQSLRSMLLRDARADGVALSFLKDRGRTGWSDHEPYELRGIPAVWLQWQEDPNYHTARDTADRLRVRPIRTTGAFLLRFIYTLDEARIRKLDTGR